MCNDNIISAVIVDTNAFVMANSDFIGLKTSSLTAFFDAINEKKILLLTHPILEREIERHIEDSGLYRDYKNLKSNIIKCQKILEQSNCYDSELLSRITEYDIKKRLVSAYNDYYKSAVKLNYPDPTIVFDLYFESKPPFSPTENKKNKKNEFPDAFVIEGVKQYLVDHPNEKVLVVSNDGDWKSAFGGTDNVILYDNIDQATEKIISIESVLSEEMLKGIFQGAYSEMLLEAQKCAEYECYELSDYEFLDDIQINSIEIRGIDSSFIPLRISREEILIKSYVTIILSGEGEIFNEANSIWDSEDGEYIFKEYADIEFVDGQAEVECEALISFDFDEPESSGCVKSFKFANRENIPIDCENTTLTSIDEDELAIRCLREDKGYPRKSLK